MKSEIFWITNFKNEEAAAGARALRLAQIHEKVGKHFGIKVAVAVSPVDVFRVASSVSIPVFSEHADPIDFGKFTGKISPQILKKSGAAGTILNHCENPLDFSVLSNSVACAQRAGLARVVCAENAEKITQLLALDIDYLAFEPPELIGSKDQSVASAAPKSIAQSVANARGIPLLVGAGISSPADVEISLKLGAKGFLVSSAVVKSADPEKKLMELFSAI